ncbi:MAG: preprotein translocase subunit SecE [bacterium]|nr:preprotein translocase subunit SecE [bacterium]
MFNKVTSFFQESRQELKRVNWPTLAETRRLTIIVIAISLGVAAFLGILDAIFLLGLSRLIS